MVFFVFVLFFLSNNGIFVTFTEVEKIVLYWAWEALLFLCSMMDFEKSLKVHISLYGISIL